MDLSKKYTKFLETGELSDTEILVGEEPNTKIFHLHSLILMLHSPYFRTALSSDWVKIENNIIKFQKKNISVEVFEIIVKYIYSGEIHFANNVKTNVELLIAADELCLDDLCVYIEEELLKDKESLKSNLVFILHIATKFSHFTKLSQFYKDTFQQDSSLIFKADDFITIKQELLLDILAEDNHCLEPIEIWDKLMEWAIFQSNELSSDVTKWTADNVSTFGTLIKPFIPHIDFKNITAFDFVRKIKPYKDIFNDDLYVKTLEYYLSDDIYSKSKMKVDSKIINSEQAFLLANFVKIMQKDALNIFYRFKLLVRGSRDGFEIDTFCKYCSYKSATITVARVKNTNEILGGFNPYEWSAGWVNFKDSFIFSLDTNNLKNSIFSKCEISMLRRLKDNKCPDFGDHGSDLRLLIDSTNKGQCYKNSYEKLIRKNEGEFEIDEYEVFQVIDTQMINK